MWYSTHWVFLVRFKDGPQVSYPIIERVVLVEAFDDTEARVKAASMAKQEQDEFTGTYRYMGGRDVDLEFLGVKKVVTLSSQDGGAEVSFAEGDDLTYWEYDVFNQVDVEKLLAGEKVVVGYVE